MTKSDNADAFKIQYQMLTIVGGWPKENPTTWYTARGAINYTLSLILCTTMLMEAYNDLTDFAKLSEILYVMLTIITYIVKHGNLFVQRKTFIRMVKLLKDPVFLSYPDDLDDLMVKRIKSSQLLANVYRYLVLIYLCFATISPLFDDQPLPYPFPYDLGKYRSLMYIFQVLATGLNAWNNSTLDSLLASFIGLAATHLEILSNKIIRIRDTLHLQKHEFSQRNDKIVAQSLKQCIEHHMAIIEYIECIDGAFSFGVLLQFMGSVIIICNTLFHVVLVTVGSSQFFALFNYLAIMLLELFMYCWFGNDVIWKSISVGEACYVADWYNCGDDVRKYLFIIMERSKRPLKITAYGFSTLSLTAFSSIIQWSYSYFALLMKLYKEQPQVV